MRKGHCYIPRSRRESVPCVTLKEQLEAVEQFGADLGDSPSEEAYMFTKQEDVDMDAFCERYVDKQKLGASSDAASYFGELSSRFGFACKAESSTPSASPAPAAPSPDNVSIT